MFGEVLVYGLIFMLVPRVVSSGLRLSSCASACAAVIVIGFLAPMYLGYHWFTDCVGGAILGALVLLIAWRALYALRRERELVRVDDLVSSQQTQSQVGSRRFDARAFMRVFPHAGGPSEADILRAR